MAKILTITDSYNWATYFRAENLKRCLKRHQFKIISFKDIDKVSFDNYDTVYVTNWPIYGYIREKISKNRKYKLVTGVSSHIGRKKAKDMLSFFSIFDGIGLSNQFLMDEFMPTGLSNLVYTPFGVNKEVFSSTSSPSSLRYSFGWVGNKDRPVKRFAEIKRVFDELGPKYSLNIVHNKSGLSRPEMADFYNSVGTVICYSESEGTPNPILEAAMCGRAIISTNVGNIPQLMANNSEFSPVSSYEDLKKQITMYSELNLDRLGKMNGGAAAKGWTWQVQSKRFLKLIL